MVRLGDLLEEKISRKKIDDSEIVTFIGMQDVSEDAVLKEQHKLRFSEVKKGLTFCEKNDVLVAKITPCFENGKGANLNILETDFGFGSTEFHVLKAKSGNNSSYIYHQTRTEAFRDKLERAMVGTAGHKRVPFSAIQEFQLPIKHNHKEQTAIAKALSDVDALIISLEKLIAKKQAIKTATMQQLLTGKKRLPGFGEGKDYKQTELGEIPEDWEVRSIQEIAHVVGGGTPSTTIPHYWNGEINWFTPTEIIGDKYVTESRRKISDKGMKSSSAKKLPVNTILITSRASIGDLAILRNEATTNQGFQSLIAFENINSEFLYYLMCTKKNEMLSLASGSTFLEISPNKIRSIRLQIPSTKVEQTIIVEIFTDMDAEIKTLQQRLSKTKKIKQGMMQELLTGRTRLI